MRFLDDIARPQSTANKMKDIPLQSPRSSRSWDEFENEMTPPMAMHHCTLLRQLRELEHNEMTVIRFAGCIVLCYLCCSRVTNRLTIWSDAAAAVAVLKVP